MEADLKNSQFPWLIFALKETKFAISSQIVHGISVVPEITEVPDGHAQARGVIQFRDAVIPMMDLRLRMGMKSCRAESHTFIDSINQREQEHVDWLNELERSVQQKREFSLTTNPHQCAFGRWYDNFEPRSHMLESLLKGFDTPHKRIHAIADEVKSLENLGKMMEAHALVERTRNGELATMIQLFAQVRKEYLEYNREIAVMYEANSELYSFAADRVEGIEELSHIEPQADNHFLSNVASPMVVATARRQENNEIIFILDANRIMPADAKDMAENSGFDLAMAS